ncbi:type II secretion system F family protein [Spirillospora albida]|uniref:type II secretion system F family protein n=1 Tax=Spirillospora albida TaxID=58123 RepID=UPI0006900301|nr:type II secretion system F family protein [Spirillospora albida]
MVTLRAAAWAVALTLAVCVPSPGALAAPSGEGSLDVGAVRAVPGSAQFYLSARGLPEGVTLDEARITASAGGRALPATVEATSSGRADVTRTVVMVIDTSGSMKGRPLAEAQDAARRYAAAVPASLRIGLVTAGLPARTVLAPTTDRAAFTAAAGNLRAGARTALYDGVAAGVALLAAQPAGERRLLVLSDGADTASATSLPLLARRLDRQDGSVDVVAFGTGTDPAALRRIADAGRGTLHHAAQSGTLAGVFLDAAAAFTAPVRVTVEVPAALAARTARLSITAAAGGRTLGTGVTVAFAADPRAATAGAPRAVTASPGPPPWLYWTGGAAMLAAVLLGAATIAPARRGLGRRRLAELEGLTAGRAAPPGAASRALPDMALALSDRVVRARGLHDRLAVQLEQAGMRLLPREWLLLRVGTAAAALLVLAVLLSPLLGILLGPAAAWAGTAAYRRRRASRRTRRFAEQLPDALQLVVGSLRSGFSLGQALAALVRESADPVGTEFGRALAETRIGVDLEDALERTAERTACRDLSWLVMAIRIQREVGGNLAEIMETAVETMRERARLRRHVHALTAEGRLSAYVLIALPICVGGWMFLMRGEYVRVLYTEPIGIAMLAGAVLFVAAGSFWMSRLIKVEV